MILLLLCLGTLCSNDMQGVLHDEEVRWDPSPGASTYDIYADGHFCFSVLASSNRIILGDSCRGDAITIRACNSSGCSVDSDPVEVLPFACLRGEGCEYPCWAGAPRRLSHLPACP